MNSGSDIRVLLIQNRSTEYIYERQLEDYILIEVSKVSEGSRVNALLARTLYISFIAQLYCKAFVVAVVDVIIRKPCPLQQRCNKAVHARLSIELPAALVTCSEFLNTLLSCYNSYMFIFLLQINQCVDNFQIFIHIFLLCSVRLYVIELLNGWTDLSEFFG